MKKIAATIAAILLLSGCGKADENYRPEHYVYSTETHAENQNDGSSESSTSIPESSSSSSTITSTVKSKPAESHNISQSVSSDSDTLKFTIDNVFSGGQYYDIVVSASKSDTEGKDTIIIDGILYGGVSLTLFKNGKQTDRLPIEVPNGEHFVLLENVADKLSYGYDFISNMREYGAEEYPDILGLIFQNDSDIYVPVYERFFTVFDGKLTELPIYQNNVEVEPRGAKLEPKSAGVAVQHLTVPKSNGNGYEIVKYEYRFDTENKRLNKQQVRFYGWEID